MCTGVPRRDRSQKIKLGQVACGRAVLIFAARRRGRSGHRISDSASLTIEWAISASGDLQVARGSGLQPKRAESPALSGSGNWQTSKATLSDVSSAWLCVPRKKNALLPLTEAISNSVHSITDVYATDAASKGKIIVRIYRQGDEPDGKVIGFDIEDNGIGFTDDNYKSFRTPDSRWKESRGGKGVGRLAWLKVFEGISIDSSYQGGAGWARRAFDFRLAENDQLAEREAPEVIERYRTVVSFRAMKSPYDSRCPVRNGIIENRIAAHFVPLFVAGNAPQMIVEDDGVTEIQTLFAESIADQETKVITVGEGDDAFHSQSGP